MHVLVFTTIRLYASSFGFDLEQVDIELPEDLPLKEPFPFTVTNEIKMVQRRKQHTQHNTKQAPNNHSSGNPKSQGNTTISLPFQ